MRVDIEQALHSSSQFLIRERPQSSPYFLQIHLLFPHVDPVYEVHAAYFHGYDSDTEEIGAEFVVVFRFVGIGTTQFFW
jgi:hypothetical protein